MKIERKCKVCKVDFTAIKTTQKYCSRKCFKKDYYLKTKKKKQYELNNPVYPHKICSYCGKTHELSFDPIVYPKLFNNFTCTNCGVPTELLMKYATEVNSFQKVTQEMFTALNSYSIEGTITVSVYKVFSYNKNEPIEGSFL